MRTVFVSLMVIFHVGIYTALGINFCGMLVLALAILLPLPPQPPDPSCTMMETSDGHPFRQTGVSSEDEAADRDKMSQCANDCAVEMFRTGVAAAVLLGWLLQLGSQEDAIWPVSNMEIFSYPEGHPCYTC